MDQSARLTSRRLGAPRRIDDRGAGPQASDRRGGERFGRSAAASAPSERSSARRRTSSPAPWHTRASRGAGCTRSRANSHPRRALRANAAGGARRSAAAASSRGASRRNVHPERRGQMPAGRGAGVDSRFLPAFAGMTGNDGGGRAGGVDSRLRGACPRLGRGNDVWGHEPRLGGEQDGRHVGAGARPPASVPPKPRKVEAAAAGRRRVRPGARADVAGRSAFARAAGSGGGKGGEGWPPVAGV